VIASFPFCAFPFFLFPSLLDHSFDRRWWTSCGHTGLVNAFLFPHWLNPVELVLDYPFMARFFALELRQRFVRIVKPWLLVGLS